MPIEEFIEYAEKNQGNGEARAREDSRHLAVRRQIFYSPRLVGVPSDIQNKFQSVPIYRGQRDLVTVLDIVFASDEELYFVRATAGTAHDDERKLSMLRQAYEAVKSQFQIIPRLILANRPGNKNKIDYREHSYDLSPLIEPLVNSA